MHNTDKAIEFLQGGIKGGLYERLAIICKNCGPEESCGAPKCIGLEILSTIEGQIAKSGLEYMKTLIEEWIKNSVEK
jgi:hypothetical protein